jgi:hypothetical protein
MNYMLFIEKARKDTGIFMIIKVFYEKNFNSLALIRLPLPK